MSNIDVFDWSGKAVEQIEIPYFLLDEMKPSLIHSRIVYEMNKARRGTHHTKGISEISGSTRKIRRQKGGGVARQGSGYDGHFRGGAVIFGPTSRSHAIKMNKKVLKKSLRSLFSMKHSSGNVRVISDLNLADHKTKNLIANLEKANLSGQSTVFIFSNNEDPVNLKLSSRNLHNINLLSVEGMNATDMMKHTNIILTKESIEDIKARLYI